MRLEQRPITILWGGAICLPVPVPVPSTQLLSGPAPGHLNLGLPKRLTLGRRFSDPSHPALSTDNTSTEAEQ